MANNGQQPTSTSAAIPSGSGYQQNASSSSTGGGGPSTGGGAEFKEFGTTTLEWKMNNLKALFEGSRGESKSRVVKSVLFGGAKWQILFYPNAGGSANEYCSLYLSCEPSPDEFVDPPGLVPLTSPLSHHHSSSSTASATIANTGTFGRWSREGMFQFRFEVKGSDGKMICVKEAANHTFASKTQNWGWAQYAKRDTVFFSNPITRSADYFNVVCSIWAVPTPPSPPETIPKEIVPKTLLHSVGMLLDDQTYSDVEFIIARKGKRKERRIWANKTLIGRAEYFSTMLSSGFAEDYNQSEDEGVSESGISRRSSIYQPNLEDSDSESEHHPSSPSPSSSADDESESERSTSSAAPSDEDAAGHGVEETFVVGGAGEGFDAEQPSADARRIVAASVASPSLVPESGSRATTPRALELSLPMEGAGEEVEEQIHGEVKGGSGEEEAGKRKTSLSAKGGVGDGKGREETAGPSGGTKEERLGPRKTRVVIKDAAYPTFFALLYYLYTDHITFAPLTSSFVNPSNPNSHSSPGRAREAWILNWMRLRPGCPRPASAKSVFVLADKMGLNDLKARAFQHIVAGLTVTNIPYEAFSAFSAAFDEVRSVEVEFFLKNWNEIKRTDGMKDVWKQVRGGRHRGFEEVWPLVISQLEFVALGGGGGENSQPTI